MQPKDLETNLIVEKLKFCGCGNPAAVLDLMYKFIKLSQAQYEDKAPALQGKEWEAYCERHRKEKRQLIIDNSEAVVWLIYFILDEKDIFTHGGNVSGGWLDDEEFFSQLEQWNVSQSDENRP